MKKLVMAGMMFVFCLASVQAEYLENSDLRARKTPGSKVSPTSWYMPKGSQTPKYITSGLPEGTQRGMEIKIDHAGKGVGLIAQSVSIDSNKEYNFNLSGFSKSSIDSLAYFEVKLIKDGKTIKRVHTGKSKTEWSKLSVDFKASGVDSVRVTCRFLHDEKNIGQTVWFAKVSLTEK